MWQQCIFVHVANQRIQQSCGCVKRITGNSGFWFNIDTTNYAAVLFGYHALKDLQQLEFDHTPLHRIRSLFVKVTDILTLDFLHRSEHQLSHRVVYVSDLRLQSHVAFEHVAYLISLRNLSEESVGHQSAILNTVLAWEQIVVVLQLYNACNKSILTEHHVLIAQLSIGKAGIVVTKSGA